MSKQLTIDGREVPAEGLRSRRGQSPITPVQRAVLRYLKEHGSIRSVDAGIILFDIQGQPWRRQYASADGLEVLKRMMKRGLVRRTDKRGVWVSTSEPE